jgi:hypothetical protein
MSSKMSMLMLMIFGIVEGRRQPAFNVAGVPSRAQVLQSYMQEPAAKKKAQSKGLDQSALIDQGIDRLADLVKKNAGKRSDPSKISMMMDRKAASRTSDIVMEDEPKPKAKAKAKKDAGPQLTAEEYGAEQVKWFNDRFAKAEFTAQEEPKIAASVDDPWSKRKVQALYDTGNLR